jgi:hypothetical protein
MVSYSNVSFIEVAKNSMFNSRLKHIDVRYLWIREDFKGKLLELEKIHTDDNDFATLKKALEREKLETFAQLVK